MITEIFDDLIVRANYAINSRSRDLVFETYGMCKMARKMNAITLEQFMQLNTMLIKNSVNNPDAKLGPEKGE